MSVDPSPPKRGGGHPTEHVWGEGSADAPTPDIGARTLVRSPSAQGPDEQ
jgi:hypothetical protein